MLSLLKKSADKEQSSSAGWHPNFRNFTELPDTKVVRTSFFVNGVAVVIVLAAALYFAFQEYNISVLNKQIRDWEAKIQQHREGSQKAIALYTQFQAEQKKVAEVQSFLSGERLVYTEFLSRLANVLPKSVAITFIDYTTSRVVLRGVVNGEPDQASGVASAFERQLKEDASFSKQFTSVALTTLARDQQSGRLTFEIAMKFEETGKKK